MTMNGPNGMSVFIAGLGLCFMQLTQVKMPKKQVPKMAPKKTANRQACQPQKAPMQASSFTSPKPMASLFKKNSAKLKKQNNTPMAKQAFCILFNMPSKAVCSFWSSG